MKFNLSSLNAENLKKGLTYLRHNGLDGVMSRVRYKMNNGLNNVYDKWYKEVHESDEEELTKQRETSFSYAPLISILVPVYMTPELYLRAMIESVTNQTYGNWELCLVDGSQATAKEQPKTAFGSSTRDENAEDETETQTVYEKVYSLETERIIRQYMEQDSRIKYKKMDTNLGISGNTNEALAMAKGEYVGLLDHDDVLTEDALYQVVKALQEQYYDALYSDEDKMTDNGNKYKDPALKPDFNIDLLRAHNYITHFFVARRELMMKDGGFNKDYDGAQDYDMILRCCEGDKFVKHIPRVLYHWRVNDASVASNAYKKEYAKDAGKRALEAHLSRMGLYGTVTHTDMWGIYKVTYDTPGNPLLSIVITGHTDKSLMMKCLQPLYELARYSNFEVIIVDEDRQDVALQKFYQQMEAMRRNITVVEAPKNKSLTELRNMGAIKSKGDYILFLDSNTEILDATAMGEMLGICMRDDVAIVSGTLYDERELTVHAGLAVGINGSYSYLYQGLKRGDMGYLMHNRVNNDYSAVAPFCMMVKRTVFAQLGGFSDKFKTELSCLDFCLRAREHEYLIVNAADAGWYYHDVSDAVKQGREEDYQDEATKKREADLFEILWSHVVKNGDPFYNPNFLRDGDLFMV